MSTAARIDELRKKFEENPRRYFAPLANEYRKAGDLSQAIALCREHLPKQPGHMSGYIVFGQALYEAGELAEARSVFEQALDLDPENLIALRHLGDIARAYGDAATARRWYERVLDADPRNDDIAAQLTTLGTGRTPISSPVIPPPSPSAQAVPSSAQPFARPIETPALGMESFGLGAMPTPDAVMRAVDLDAFTNRVTTPAAPAPAAPTPAATTPVDRPVLHSATPIDLDAIEDLGSAAASASSPSPKAEADAFDFPAEAEFVEPTVNEIAGGDLSSVSLGLSSDGIDDMAIDLASGGYGALPVAETVESFEEGLVAPEWPDTSDLVSRRLTPRAPTPISLTPQSLTPVSSEAVADAVAAFGAEPHEAPVAEPELAVDVEPIVEATIPQIAESVMEPVGDAVDALVVDVADEFVIDAADEFVIDAAQDVVVEAVAEPVVEPVVEPLIEAEFASIDETVQETVEASVETSVEQSVESLMETTLPWLTVPDAPVATEAELAAEQPGLEELAEVFAGDARAAGIATPVIVEAIEDPEPTLDVQSFADLAAVVDEVSDEMMTDAQAVADEPVEMALFGSVAPDAEPMETPAVGSAPTHDAFADEPFVAESFVEPSFDESAFAESAFAESSFSADFSETEVGDAEFSQSESAHDESYEALSHEAATESPAFVTETMAELLVSQGFIGRAADVYEELVRRRPFDPVLDARLAELRAMLAPAPVEATPMLSADIVEPQSEWETPRAFASDAADEVASTFAESSAMPADATDAEAIAASFEDPTFVPIPLPTPAYGTPAFGTPLMSMPVAVSQPSSFTPEMSSAVSPLVTPPVSHHATPYAQPAMESSLGRRTARDWFAALAARRVPRRTPAQSAPAIEHPAEGLASLFGTDPVAHDDSAARALADAFAPLSAQDLAGGSMLDFEYARATPAFGAPASVTPSLGSPTGGMSRMTPVVPPRAMSGTPAGTFAPIAGPDVSPMGGGGNAGFAFDKFFPDPATRRGTPATSMPTASDAPVTDDLAQFSAWLKGLGNT